MTSTEPLAHTDQPSILYDVRDGVATLTLNRPDRLNAWTFEMNYRYPDLLRRAGVDPEVRAIIVTGAGRGFCAGAEMDNLDDIESGEFEADTAPERVPTVAIAIPKPVIAVINGPCAGYGLILAAACDLRFSTPEAKITSAFVRLGLIAEYGSAWLLSRLVGPGNALDILLSGRIFTGEEAERMGFVNACHPADRLLVEAHAYAAELARSSAPRAMATIKKQVYAALEAGLAESVESAHVAMHRALRASDFKEGLVAYREKRQPQFAPIEIDP